MKTNYDILNTTPTIPAAVYRKLPPFLKDLCDKFEDQREKDVVITSCLTILSGCFTGIKGMYGKDWIGPSLYSFIVAPPANRKGSMKFSKKLGAVIQKTFEDENAVARTKYEAEYKRWEAMAKKNSTEAGDPPKKPKYPVLFIPGNSSAAAIYWLLNESNGKAIICETEADSLAGAIKQDWGNFSHILRCAFHHEPITISRKGDYLYQHIEYPQLSVLLTGTPDQVSRLIGSTEDGLCSRFLFYCFSQGLRWIDQTPCKDCIDYSLYFSKLGIEVAKVKKQLDTANYTFSLSGEQFKILNENFSGKLNQIRMFEGLEATSAVKRLGVIAFRIAMILTVIRQKDELKDKVNLECSNEDFSAAMGLTDVYFEHSMAMYAMLPSRESAEFPPKLRVFFTALPIGDKFPRRKANEIGATIGISEKTVGNYLGKLVKLGYLTNPEYGFYCKAT